MCPDLVVGGYIPYLHRYILDSCPYWIPALLHQPSHWTW
jgi:hypothetical protein